MSDDQHVPVLLEKVLSGLAIKQDGIYVDGTFGRGGHSSAILERLGEEGRLIAIDRDPQAIASAGDELRNDPRLTLVRSDFAELATCMGERGVTGQVDGLLFDLGVSSPQLDEAARGFSFRRDGPLDMRMDPDAGVSAADWLQSVEERTLRQIIFKYGEERDAPRIARAIVAARNEGAINSTLQLQIESVLKQSLDVLKRGGRLCVISFHSLEDRIVKRFMREASRESEQYRGMPDVPAEHQPKLKLVGKAITASEDEIAANVRARSAHLRIAERT
jgi:16S rRNA (cytosine1402-N4)-methyltransferase